VNTLNITNYYYRDNEVIEVVGLAHKVNSSRNQSQFPMRQYWLSIPKKPSDQSKTPSTSYYRTVKKYLLVACNCYLLQCVSFIVVTFITKELFG